VALHAASTNGGTRQEAPLVKYAKELIHQLGKAQAHRLIDEI
jgi:hypothetical protein